MCGITGRFNSNGDKINFESAIHSLISLNHRGPDDWGMLFADYVTGEFHNVGVGLTKSELPADLYLGHVRLSIIDVNGGRQPMMDATGRCHIVFNGEIYNYLELREILKSKGYRFVTASDTEVILNSYLEYGYDCVKYLNGMFAFAIYDRLLKIIFCARDRLGIKPFYYFHDNEKFIFASEVKSILCWDDIPIRPDYRAMIDYLTYLFYLGDYTLFKGIKSLRPGYSMTIGKKKLLFNRYWKPSIASEMSMKEDWAKEELRDLLTDSIRLQMRSDVPIGTHLSGGTDSSAIAGLLSRLCGSRIYSFTGRFNEGGDYDELRMTKHVSEHIGSDLQIITPTSDHFKEYLDKIIWHSDYPAVGPGAFPQFMVAKLATERVKVVLGGQGGDEIFMGYPRYIRTIIENKFISGQEDSSINNKSSLQLLSYYRKNYGIGGVAGWILKRGLKSFPERYALSSARLYGLQKYFVGELLEEYRQYNPIDAAIELLTSSKCDNMSNIMSWFDIQYYLQGLLQVEDRTSMAWSLESRVPLLDHRIVEFVFKIPPHIRLKNLIPKYIFLKAVEDILPEHVKRNPKKLGFATPIGLWFNGELRQFVNDIVNENSLRKRGVLNATKLAHHLNSESRWLWTGIQQETLLWALLNLELWFRIYIDSRPTLTNTIGFSTKLMANIKQVLAKRNDKSMVEKVCP